MSRHLLRGVWSTLFLLAAISAQGESLRIVGRAIDSSGRPLEGVEIARVDPESRLAGAVMATTGIDGMFEIGLERRVADKDGLLHPEERVILQRRGRASMEMELTAVIGRYAVGVDRLEIGDVSMPSGVNLRGTVRDESGKPIGGARIEADELTEGSRFPLFAYDFSDGLSAQPEPMARAVSGADGKFELRGALPAGLRVCAKAEGYDATTLGPITFGDRLDLTLAVTGFVRGVTVDSKGKPTSAMVHLTDALGDIVTVKSGVDGQFAIALPSVFRYRVDASGDAPIDGQPEAAESGWFEGPRNDLRISVPPPAAVVKGLVVRVVDDESGEPLDGVRAGVTWQGFLIEIAPDALSAMRFVTLEKASPEGAVTLAGPSPESGETTGMLVVTAPGHATSKRKVEWAEGGLAWEVRLPKMAPVRGVVTDAVTGEPVRARVGVRPSRRANSPMVMAMMESDGDGTAVATAPDGSFQLSDLPLGEFEIVATMPDRPCSPAISIDSGTAKERDGLSLVIPRGATLNLQLKAEAGSLDGTWLVASCGSDDADAVTIFRGAFMQSSVGSLPIKRECRVGQDGKVGVSGLAPGLWSLSLRPAGSREERVGQEVELGTVRIDKDDVTQVFSAPNLDRGRVTGRVVIEGAELPPERLVVLGRRVPRGNQNDPFRELLLMVRAEARAAVDRSGSFELSLPSSTWTLSVVDQVTGIELASIDEFEIAPGQAVTRELNVKCGAVRLHIVPELEGQRVRGRLITIVLPNRPAPTNPFEPDFRSPSGLRLVDDRREQLVFLPQEVARISVMPFVDREFTPAGQVMIGGPGIAGGVAPNPDGIEVRAKPGEVVDVELKVKAR